MRRAVSQHQVEALKALVEDSSKGCRRGMWVFDIHQRLSKSSVAAPRALKLHPRLSPFVAMLPDNVPTPSPLPPEPPVPDPLIGRIIGEYVLREKLKEGGQGAIYRAEQPGLGREVVVKVLLKANALTAGALQRFMREAKLASTLDHPFAAHVYGFGHEADGLLWIAMEYVRGIAMNDLIARDGGIPLARLVPLVERLCEVVHAAHEQGIIHRDLKPSNIVVISRAGRYSPKLLDLGIAKLQLEGTVPRAGEPPPLPAERIPGASPEDELIEDSDATAALGPHATPGTDPSTWNGTPGSSASQTTGELLSSALSNDLTRDTQAVLGTPAYMAPEQWIPSAVTDARTDVYSLGIVFYQALTGKHPFRGRRRMYRAETLAPDRLPPLGEVFPQELEAVLTKATAWMPGERHASILEFAAALRTAAKLQDYAETLPQLDVLTRNAVLAAAPQPIAESVSSLDVARTPAAAGHALEQCATAVARYLGVLALACRIRVGGTGPAAGGREGELLSRLQEGRPDGQRWLELARELIRPFCRNKKAHPIPELVAFFFNGSADDDQVGVTRLEGLFHDLRSADFASDQASTRLARALPVLSRVLGSLAFLADYPLVVMVGRDLELWMGVRHLHRSRSETVLDGVDSGDVFLLSPEGELAVRLSPLVQALAPSPGVPEELFLLDGSGKLGAVLVALPAGFERQDEQVWTVLAANGLVVAGAARRVTLTELAPYRGLAPFRASDVDDFYGREFKAQSFANLLRVQPLLALVGPSGAGKSSFLQAGVLPLLPAGWRAITTRPGADPFGALAAQLAEGGVDAQALRAALSADPKALGRRLRGSVGEGGILLVVDQFEELVTLCADPKTRELFAQALLNAGAQLEAPVRVVIALRDDFLLRVQRIPALSDRLASRLEFLDTPDPEDLRRILTEPARRAGYAFEDEELVEEMVTAVSERPGALALLSFTALKLWDLRDRHYQKLTRKAYQALGGVGGALAQHAENTLAGLGLSEQKLVREIFRHLVTSVGTRAVLSRSQIEQLLRGGAATDRVLERLVSARMLVTSEGDNGEDRIEVIHEALLSSWPRLVAWQREDAEGARVRDEIRAAARQWGEKDRPRGMLWRAELLAEYRPWRARYPGRLTDLEETFAAASLRDEKRGEWLRRGAVAGVLLLLGGVWGGIQLKARHDLDLRIERQLTEGAREVDAASALKRRQEMLRAQAFEKFDAPAKREGEKLWAQALKIHPELQSHLLRAGNALELALSLDPRRPASRKAIVDLLYERALQAEQLAQDDQKVELLERLSIYDVDGSARARWNAPGRLALSVTPPSAHAVLERYDDELRGRTPVGEYAASDLQSLPLPPASYLLTLSGPQTASVRFPFVIGRGLTARGAITVPAAGAVPEGYVDIPPGDFQFGFPGAESLRGQFDTVPQHPRSSGEFLIGRHEVTFGEWIAYLKALPPAIRAKRIAKHKAACSQGQAVVELLPKSHWQMRAKIEASAYKVRDDELLRYRSRPRMGVQRWQKMPVMAMSFHEAAQYAQWLDASGRLPGARLCNEYEWERAARGADARLWPHGNRLAPEEANYDETYGKNTQAFGPDEVGSHPASQSPFGLEDMAGNLNEWTVSVMGDGPAVVRSGAYFFSGLVSSTFNRTAVDANLTDNVMGIRVCAPFPLAKRH